MQMSPAVAAKDTSQVQMPAYVPVVRPALVGPESSLTGGFLPSHRPSVVPSECLSVGHDGWVCLIRRG